MVHGEKEKQGIARKTEEKNGGRRDGGKKWKNREEQGKLEKKNSKKTGDPTKALNNGKFNLCTCHHIKKPYSLAPMRLGTSEEMS